MTEYASLSKYLSKNVQVVTQVVNNKKVMAKTPLEANLYGNWCVRKGLNLKSGPRNRSMVQTRIPYGGWPTQLTLVVIFCSSTYCESLTIILTRSQLLIFLSTSEFLRVGVASFISFDDRRLCFGMHRARVRGPRQLQILPMKVE